MASSKTKVPIQSTAGAVPIRNEKGEISMEKVKVSRYVSGKRPEYAPESSDEEEDLEFGMKQKMHGHDDYDSFRPKNIDDLRSSERTGGDQVDRRLRRLQGQRRDEEERDDDDNDRLRRHRRLNEPEVLAAGEGSEDEGQIAEEDDDEEGVEERRRCAAGGSSEESSEEEEELNEEEMEQRRKALREKSRQKRDEEEVMDVVEEEREGSEAEEKAEEESSEYEEYSDSEEEESGPRLKPVFVRKKDRVTIQEKEKEARKQVEVKAEAQRFAEERRRQTLKIAEELIRKDMVESQKADGDNFNVVITDDENDEEEYEGWKVRELKRIKRDRDERETREKEKLEIERIHNMTEEERREELKNLGKVVTNKAAKGKYKFLQKYYHRGVFFMDQEEGVYKRDISAPTLEDHFDKTVLPKVMQVKNFGRSGRTKYTHLVDQDTTEFESPWISDTAMNLKFHNAKGGGTKQVFERPSARKRN